MVEEKRESSRTFTPLLKLLIFTLVVPCSVTLWVPYFYIASSMEWAAAPFGALSLAGILSIILGIAGYLWCALDFAFVGRGTPAPIDPPRILVARGLYRFLRNPMYVSVMLVLLGESLLFRSRTLLLYAVVVWIFFHLFVFLYEEPALRRKFGESYSEYCKAVPRWFPRPPSKTG